MGSGWGSQVSYAWVHTEDREEVEGEAWDAYDRGLEEGQVLEMGGGRGRGGQNQHHVV